MQQEGIFRSQVDLHYMAIVHILQAKKMKLITLSLLLLAVITFCQGCAIVTKPPVCTPKPGKKNIYIIDEFLKDK
ncbi:hypothetical protein LSH36_3491g00003 [Paralvinella palmiformis]|uniref:Uncharacterized protein n=1 Tax=Paralvinella palmiformis TaxID=53620 RepID=A0AAD9MNI9_9ANNE|nr:hypothetical protein LSH36_3491g00003 [Paralvinella palmiformis]